MPLDVTKSITFRECQKYNGQNVEPCGTVQTTKLNDKIIYKFQYNSSANDVDGNEYYIYFGGKGWVDVQVVGRNNELNEQKIIDSIKLIK